MERPQLESQDSVLGGMRTVDTGKSSSAEGEETPRFSRVSEDSGHDSAGTSPDSVLPGGTSRGGSLVKEILKVASRDHSPAVVRLAEATEKGSPPKSWGQMQPSKGPTRVIVGFAL